MEEARADQDQTAQARWRRQVPENEVPASVAFDAVLAENDEVAVFVSGLRVFSTGVQFRVQVRTRTAPARPGRGLHEALYEGGEDQLLLGVELADGRRCSNLGLPDLPVGDAERPFLTPGGGGGGGRSADLSLFLSPVPPSGELRLICAWPAQGIAERVTLLPAEDIAAAARRVVELWPWEPEQYAPVVPELPQVAGDSWFGTEIRRARAAQGDL